MSRNAALFALMCLVWGLTWLPVKVGVQHVPPVFLAAARFLIAGVLMLLIAGPRRFAVPSGLHGRVLLTALMLNTGNYALLFWGTAKAPTGLAAIVNFATIPLFTIIAARLVAGEAIGPRKLAAIGLGTVGLGFLFATRAFGAAAGAADPLEIWGLAAIAAGTALYCVGAVLSRPMMNDVPTLTLAGWQTLIGGVGLALVSLALEPVTMAHVRALASWPVLPALAFLVVGGSLIGFTVYMRLVGAWGAFRAGLYAFVSPAIAVGAGVVALGEPFGPSEALGAALMFAAAAVALRR
ncbi:EamA family transporter [Bosea sp. TWI1241]|uniref:DMT family transporter n=1 Tax=Bosea sp. TWI1241 TaxID=3148904 RepID=UPI0032083C60